MKNLFDGVATALPSWFYTIAGAFIIVLSLLLLTAWLYKALGSVYTARAQYLMKRLRYEKILRAFKIALKRIRYRKKGTRTWARAAKQAARDPHSMVHMGFVEPSDDPVKKPQEECKTSKASASGR